ncbi:cytochrome P450 17A2 isoform X2 [Scleropages formosus]|uniref:cytochrome P450 17A2 isoform X2 n=1 Tax=Scleropages formosus TaxID=113540 RepID=UPI0010FA8BAF|nr:steroid 17-alpha-hydroxylase/17,20 lyase-like isoform X2 [Scleropages formosus]
MKMGDCWVAVVDFPMVALLLMALAAALAVLALRGRAVRAGRSSIPCLPSLPLLGSLLSLRSSPPPHLLFTQLGRKYGSPFALHLGPHYTVVVNNFKHAREVLLQRGKEFAGRPKMVTTELLSRGGKDIAFADYSPLWKSHRRLVHASFTMFGEGSNTLQNIVCEEAASLCSDLSAQSGQPVDLELPLMQAVTNVVCTLVFGSTYQPHDPEFHSVMEYNSGIVQTIARGNVVDIFPWLKIFPNKDLKKLKECIRVRDELLSKKLEEHKATYSPEETRDLLDALLKGQRSSGDESSITDDHVLMTAAEVFGAGPGQDPPGAGQADRTRPHADAGGPGPAALPGEHPLRGDEDSAREPRANPPRGPAGHQENTASPRAHVCWSICGPFTMIPRSGMSPTSSNRSASWTPTVSASPRLASSRSARDRGSA